MTMSVLGRKALKGIDTKLATDYHIADGYIVYVMDMYAVN